MTVMAISRASGRGYAARRYPAEFGLEFILSKVEILGPDRAVDLQARGMPYVACCLPRGDASGNSVLAMASGQSRRRPGRWRDWYAGRWARCLPAWTPATACWRRLRHPGGEAIIQASDRMAHRFYEYRELFAGVSGVDLLENIDVKPGEIPAGFERKACDCPDCLARGGW